MMIFMMILGIAGCTALMITGMGINDSIKNVVDYQFTEISLYDYTVTFADPLTDADREAFMADTAKFVGDALFLHETTVTAVAGREEKEGSALCAHALLGDEQDQRRGDQDQVPVLARRFPEDMARIVVTGEMQLVHRDPFLGVMEIDRVGEVRQDDNRPGDHPYPEKHPLVPLSHAGAQRQQREHHEKAVAVADIGRVEQQAAPHQGGNLAPAHGAEGVGVEQVEDNAQDQKEQVSKDSRQARTVTLLCSQGRSRSFIF